MEFQLSFIEFMTYTHTGLFPVTLYTLFAKDAD